MRLLLDTNAFIWAVTAPRRLGRSREPITDGENELLISAVVAWELAIKYAIGRMPLPSPPEIFVPDRTERLAATQVPVTHAHALGVAALPMLHRDPFDRLLISQAQQLGATLVTGDRAIAAYDVETLLV